jgi:RNA polymerase sigma-70 factor (ECF subfamily)
MAQMTDQPRPPLPEGVESMPDEAVVARVLAGDPRLFELLMRRHNRRLFRVARAIVRDDGEAEDVAQDAWVRAFDHLSSFEGRALFSTWVTRICVHESLARVRKSGRFGPLAPDGEQQEAVMSTGTPEQRASDGELRRALEDAIDGLPEPMRTAFMMREVEGMSTSETAEALGIPEDTVKTRAFRARALLKQRLSERFDALTTGAFDFLGARCDRMVARDLERIARRR